MEKKSQIQLFKFTLDLNLKSLCRSQTLANLTATPMRIEYFSVFRVSAQSQRIRSESQRICSGVTNEQSLCNLLKNCSIRSAVSVEWYSSVRVFAVHSPSNRGRVLCEPTETAERLWRMHGDCAANHNRFDGNDVVECFVINFILRNKEWWKVMAK